MQSRKPHPYFSAFILLLIFCFYGCHKVIQVNLSGSAPQIVITGEVNNLPGPYTVTISRSVNYSADNTFPPVSGAMVFISGNGMTDTLAETTPGTYTTHSLQGVQDSSYTLNVFAEGRQYTAVSVMPQQVPLDSIGYMNSFNAGVLNAMVYFRDPPGVANYYQFIGFSNGKPFPNSRGWSVFDDRLSDGRYISLPLYDDSADFKPGDTLALQMNCVDQNVYNYLYTLSEITNTQGFASPSPANPVSNITNNALGYFSANTRQVKTLIVP